MFGRRVRSASIVFGDATGVMVFALERSALRTDEMRPARRLTAFC